MIQKSEISEGTFQKYLKEHSRQVEGEQRQEKRRNIRTRKAMQRGQYKHFRKNKRKIKSQYTCTHAREVSRNKLKQKVREQKCKDIREE